MANISAQSTRFLGRVQNYAKKDYVAISAVGAPVATFEEHLRANRVAHGKNGVRPRVAVGDDGELLRDEDGHPVPARNSSGKLVWEAEYVQAYSLVESFGHDELDPDDPDSWERAQTYGRAVAEDLFPDHMALIATEVSGRSGCVHNHIIIDAINAKTGRSLDSNRVTHARLAIAHDELLEKKGFTQREDMARSAAKAREAMAAAEAEVRAQHEGTEISESQLQRKIVSAQKRVKVERTDQKTPVQKRDERRRREFDRYQLTERTRAIAMDIGIAPPPQKFSEIELEARIRDTLGDHTVTTWEDVARVGREHGVTIKPRGKDLVYGMMLADSQGELTEPSRAHTRRGKSLGDGFGREDIEAVLADHVGLKEGAGEAAEVEQTVTDTTTTAEPTPVTDSPKRKSFEEMLAEAKAAPTTIDTSLIDEYAAEHGLQPAWKPAETKTEPTKVEKIETISEVPAPAPAKPAVQVSEPEELEQGTPAVEQANQVVEKDTDEVLRDDETVAVVDVSQKPQAPAFRSKLHTSRSSSKTVQARIDGVAAMEERWHGRMPETPEEREQFEQQIRDFGGIGPRFLTNHGERLDPEMRAALQARADMAKTAQGSFQRAKDLRTQHEQRLKDQPRNSIEGRYDKELTDLNRSFQAANKKTNDVKDAINRGDYLRPAHELEQEKKARHDAIRRRMGWDTSESPGTADRLTATYQAQQRGGSRGLGE